MDAQRISLCGEETLVHSIFIRNKVNRKTINETVSIHVMAR